MFKEYDVTDRITDEKLSLEITDTLYVKSLLDVVDFLCTELRSQLLREMRFKGIMVTYDEKVKKALSQIIEDQNIETLDFFGRTLYLLKKSLKKEHLRLTRKRLSPADSTICLVRKILKIVKDSLPPTFENKKELEIVEEVIDKVWSNIRINSKKDPLFAFSNLIRDCLRKKLIGKYSTDVFEIEEKKRDVQLLEGDGTRLCIDGENKIGEILL